MSTQAQQLLAVALLAGGFALAGPPVPKPVEQAAHVGQDAPVTPAQPPKPAQQDKVTVAVPEPQKRPKAAPVPKPAVKERRQKQRQPEAPCERIRRRLAATPTRVFSCAEMKAARACERPGDRGRATPAQIAKGWECWSSGQL